MSDQSKTRGRGKSEKKKIQILEAASTLFLSQGINATSMEQLAEGAGVSKQTLYSHFGSKEELFVAAIEQRCTHYELDNELFDDQRPVQNVLRDLAAHLMDLLLSEDAIKLHRLCISGVDQFPEISKLFYDAGPRSLLKLFSAYLERQTSARKLKIENCEFAAQQFLFMVKGEAHMESLLDLEYQIKVQVMEKYLDSCVSFFMKAYACRS